MFFSFYFRVTHISFHWIRSDGVAKKSPDSSDSVELITPLMNFWRVKDGYTNTVLVSLFSIIIIALDAFTLHLYYILALTLEYSSK